MIRKSNIETRFERGHRSSLNSRFETKKKRGGSQMSKASVYEEKTEKLILPILEEMNFELVDIEYVREGSTWYLRAYIDKEGGITINDCEVVARRMNDLLDAEDFIEDSYVFEVSSPGLGRPLKKEKDFARNIGKSVEIRTYRAIDRCKEFCGTLKAYDKDSVTIADEKERTTTFMRADIALIRQAIDF
jgi:ribosome maturation factor RimP